MLGSKPTALDIQSLVLRTLANSVIFGAEP